MSEGRGRVLVSSDEAALRRGLARTLLTRGFDVDTADGLDAALTLLEARPADALALDVARAGDALGAWIGRARAAAPDVTLVALVARGALAAGVAAVDAGAYDFAERPPLNDDLLAQTLGRAVERSRAAVASRALSRQAKVAAPLGEILGESRAMRGVVRLAHGVAGAPTSALVIGEPGTGKSLVAGVIHARSARAALPLHAIDCGVIGEAAIERELFGDAHRAGLVERADGATVLLEDVTQLPMPAQARLAEVLARGAVRRADAARSVDVRVIATAAADVDARMRDGAFREDLFFRLGVVVIRLPRLAQRKDDIPLLAYAFLHAAARRAGRDVRRVGTEALRALRAYPWPGNVRELEQAMGHAALLARGEAVMTRDLPFSEAAAALELGPRRALFSAELADLPYPTAKERAITAFDKAYVERVFDQARGNLSEAARRAGMDRSNFRRLFNKARERGDG